MYDGYRNNYGQALGGTVFFGLVALITVSSLLRGIVLTVMWGWFVEPLGVPSISVAQAIGLALVVGLLLPGRESTDDKSGDFAEKLVSALVMSIITPVAYLIFGWIVQLFM